MSSLEETKPEPITRIVQEYDQSSDGEPEALSKLDEKTFLAVFAVCLIYIAQLFALVGAGAQGNTIAAHFNSADSVSWITAPITILTAVLCPIVSQAADFWGRKPFLIACTLSGAVGCIVVARASSMAMVIAGFTVVGIAFGAQSLLHTVASEVLPRRWRSWAQSTIMMSNGFGLGIGLIVGGALNEHGNPDGFRNHFYIAMSLFIIATIICVFVYNPPATELQLTLSFKQKLEHIDWIGYVLLASGLVLFCLGLSYLDNPYAWSDSHVSAIFAVGLALAVGLVVYETWFKKDGIFHHGLFRANRNFVIAVLCVFCEGISFFAGNTYFAFQVSVLYETNFLIIGVRFSLAFLGMFLGAVTTGLYCAITKKLRFATVVAFVIFTTFFVCMATTTKDSSTAVWGYPILLGWALGMTLVTLVTIAQLSVPPELITISSGLLISVRSLGGTIGIAIYNSVFKVQMAHLSTNIGNAAVGAGLPLGSVSQFVTGIIGQNSTELVAVPGITPGIIGAGADALLNTYSKAFRNVWITALPFVVVAAIVSVFLFDPSKEFNNHIDAPIEVERERNSG
ncbi:major facilitator superfamily domain-containing protein [Calycina marina]|uniref:Major facilitator superfamily domain-containing protein n=1 Tax=Calycina marina TaxID=1763456 RepID=A0A9P7Z7A7_9HELO|nr:major facilitator superfamily domain-containing protein [Calycina marina]